MKSLLDIHAIGKKKGKALEKVGVGSLEVLRKMDIDRVSEATGIHKELLRHFKSIADLMLIPGVDQHISEALVKNGISSFQKLAKVEPERLKAVILGSMGKETVREGYKDLGEKDFREWIHRAKDLSHLQKR
ncbi:MAG: DUF4332 domain-containing protein [Bacteroidota bacterium]